MTALPTEDASRYFARALIDWQRRAGRHDLPWQRDRDAYRIWLSEIMLQQTQVATVLRYYERFIARFPSVRSLAEAPLDDVMALWSGLGYYSRARNLHRAACAVVERHGGRFPTDAAALQALPGVGRSTAAAIAVFAAGAREAILDGNVKRVLARHFAVAADVGERAAEARLWALASALVPSEEIESYTQGLMDLGATLCLPRNPRCPSCPLESSCIALREGRVAELPAVRRRAARPQREAILLVLERAGRILFEKRPPHGIWGGLWSFPELTSGDALTSWLRERLGCSAELGAPLPPLRHEFTHFSLDIHPLYARVLPPDDSMAGSLRAADDNLRWHPCDEMEGFGAPAPVKRIVDSLRQRASAPTLW